MHPDLIISQAVKPLLFLLLVTVSFWAPAQPPSPCLAHDTIVQIIVEQDARFQDGDISNFAKYIASNIQYPAAAYENLYEGKSVIKFVVGWDGLVKDVSVFKSSGHKILDKEAVRVIKNSPAWTPARTNNICVPQQLIFPVEFKHLGVFGQ